MWNKLRVMTKPKNVITAETLNGLGIFLIFSIWFGLNVIAIDNRT